MTFEITSCVPKEKMVKQPVEFFSLACVISMFLTDFHRFERVCSCNLADNVIECPDDNWTQQIQVSKRNAIGACNCGGFQVVCKYFGYVWCERGGGVRAW